MNQKSIEHIALYSLVLVGTLVVGVLARQFVLSKGVDDFSSIVAFFAAVIVLMAIYASLQTTFNQFLLPRIEAFLLRSFAFQTMTARCLIHFFFTGASLCRCITFPGHLLTSKGGETAPDGHNY